MAKKLFRIEGIHKTLMPLLLAAALILPSNGADAARKLHNPHMVVRAATKAPQGFQGICNRYQWACAAEQQSSMSDTDVMRLARQVNSQVNRRVRSISDTSQYRREEVWALPTRRGGDCEDFALLKKRELITAGVAPNRLLIATVLDRRRRGHAVLILRTAEGDMVLDNLTNRIRHWGDTGYTFLKLQNPDSPDSWDAILAGGLFG